MAVIDSAELLLQAKNYSGSGDWLDEANSHDASPINSPSWDGTEWTLDGSNYFTLVDHANLNFNNADFTIMVVGSVTVAAAEQACYSKYDFSDGQELSLNTSAVRIRGADGSLNDIDSTGTIVAGVEFVAAAVYDDTAATLEAFFNGVGSGSPTSLALTDQTNTYGVEIGRRSAGGLAYTGTIKAVAVWRSALSDADVVTAGAELLDSEPINRTNIIFVAAD